MPIEWKGISKEDLTRTMASEVKSWEHHSDVDERKESMFHDLSTDEVVDDIWDRVDLDAYLENLVWEYFKTDRNVDALREKKVPGSSQS